MPQTTIGIAFFSDRETYCRMVPQFPVADNSQRFDESDLANDDWLVMTLPNDNPFVTQVPKERRILILGEPSPMHTISAKYANQFGILVSPYTIEGFRGNWFASHPGLPCFFGIHRHSGDILSFQQLVELPVPDKVPELSVVVSNKTFHAGHRSRLRLVEQLQKKLGSRLHVYGRGIREVGDKAEAILPFAYHLALENSIEPNYWSEKLSDAFLGYAFPLYAGCPNVTNWFSADSFQRIGLDRIEDTVDEIVHFLDRDTYHERLASIQHARNLVLFHETVFNVISRAVATYPSQAPRLPNPDTILPIKKSASFRFARRSIRAFHKLTTRRRIRISA